MEQKIKLDITPDLFPPTIKISRYDVGRTFKIDITDKVGGDYEIPAGAVAKIQGTKRSGLGFNKVGVINGNVITFTTDLEMSDEDGRIPAEVRITDEANGTDIGSCNFILEVERATHTPETPDGSRQFTVPELTLILENLREASRDAEAEMGQMTEIRNAAETAKNEAESAAEEAQHYAETAASVFNVLGDVSFAVAQDGGVSMIFPEEE